MTEPGNRGDILTDSAMTMYKHFQFWGLAREKRQELNNNNLKNVQGISGFGRFFVK
jgi:hypothetical protein